MDVYLWEINQIYHTYNIYKSIIIVDSSSLPNLYNLMQKQDYPITTRYDIEKFIDNQARILLLDINEANDIHNVVEYLKKDEINVIICIDNEIRLRQFENAHHIFL